LAVIPAGGCVYFKEIPRSGEVFGTECLPVIFLCHKIGVVLTNTTFVKGWMLRLD
jgi:hypothetical protein